MNLSTATAALAAWLAKDEQANEDYSMPPNMGWRTWNVRNGWLHSPTQHTKWESPRIEGQCKDGKPFSQCFKLDEHLCGIHSAKTPQRLLDEGYFNPSQGGVVGTIRHHGTTLEGTKGHRSANATVDTIWSPNHQVADQLEQNYPGVQVIRENHPYFVGDRADPQAHQASLQAQRIVQQKQRAAAAKAKRAVGQTVTHKIAQDELAHGTPPADVARKLNEGHHWHHWVTENAKPVSNPRKLKAGDLVYGRGSGLDPALKKQPFYFLGNFTQQGGGGTVVMSPEGKIRKLPAVEKPENVYGGDPASLSPDEQKQRLRTEYEKKLEHEKRVLAYSQTNPSPWSLKYDKMHQANIARLTRKLAKL